MVNALIVLLIVVLVVGLIATIIVYCIDLLPMDGPFKQIARLLVIVIACLIIILKALPLLGMAIN